MSDLGKNRFKTDCWKADSLKSVDLYNQWFMTSAPKAFREARKGVIKNVMAAIDGFDLLRRISIDVLIHHPQYLSVLRSCTAPPLAIDRLAGLSGTTRNFVASFEKGKLPKKLSQDDIRVYLDNVISIIMKLIDYDIFPWLKDIKNPSSQMVNRSASIIADRISGALADPIIRNSQEIRQLTMIGDYLESRGYVRLHAKEIQSIESMPKKTFAFHLNVPVVMGDEKSVNMPIDVVIQPKYNEPTHFPLLVECKSAGDFANTNKRRKEEATKINQLRHTYGENSITFILFLCGYFDYSYLGYEASENIDWVWEHRITDFLEFGV